jgi:hypothetical protein
MHQTVIATLYQHRAQSCTQTEEALKELHIQHILHEMFQQMREMLHTKFRFIWLGSFRGEDFLDIDQSETRIVCGGHVC